MRNSSKGNCLQLQQQISCGGLFSLFFSHNSKMQPPKCFGKCEFGLRYYWTSPPSLTHLSMSSVEGQDQEAQLQDEDSLLLCT